MNPTPQPVANQHRPGSALSYPATQDALARYRQRCRHILTPALPTTGVAVLAMIGVVALGRDRDGSPSGGLLVVATAAAVLVIGSATLAVVAWSRLRVARRMEWTLANYPWVTRAGYQLEQRLHWSSPPALVIQGDQLGGASKHNIFTGIDTRRVCVESLYRSVGGPLLVAGDIRQEAVITTPDMQELATIKPYRRFA